MGDEYDAALHQYITKNKLNDSKTEGPLPFIEITEHEENASNDTETKNDQIGGKTETKIEIANSDNVTETQIGVKTKTKTENVNCQKSINPVDALFAGMESDDGDLFKTQSPAPYRTPEDLWGDKTPEAVAPSPKLSQTDQIVTTPQSQPSLKTTAAVASPPKTKKALK